MSDKIKKTIKDAGTFLGAAFKTIGGYVNQGVQKVGEFIDTKVEEPQEKGPVDPATKEKWDKIKKGTGDALTFSKDLYNKYLSPVVDRGIGYGKEIIEKIEKSENPKVKYATCKNIQYFRISRSFWKGRKLSFYWTSRRGYWSGEITGQPISEDRKQEIWR